MYKSDIGSIIETKDIVSNNLSTAFNCIKVDTGYYLMVFRDNDWDGHLVTFSITESNGDIGNTISNWEFAHGDTVNSVRIIKISGTTYAIVYSLSQAANAIYVKTFTVSSTGTITESFIDTLTLPLTNEEPQQISDIIKISGDVYAIVYSELAFPNPSLGVVVTVTIDSAGAISNTVVDSLNFAAASKGTVSIVKVGTTDYYAIAFIDTNNDPVVVTVDIASNGTIAGAVTDTQVLANVTGGLGNIVRVPGTNYYAVAVGRPGTAGTIYTCSIDNSGAITNGSNGDFDTNSASGPYMISLGGDAFVVAYTGVDNDGFIVSITVGSDGTVGSVIESLEFKLSNVLGVYVLYLGYGNYAITYGASVEDDVECATLGVVTGELFPSDPVARVSSIRHICRPGFFRMQVGVGDIGLDIDLAESSVRTALDTAFEPEYIAREKFLAAQRDAEGVIPAGIPFGERGAAAAAARLTDVVSPKTAPTVPPPEVGELTDYAKRIMETPGAKALQTRIAGLQHGVEAVITPRTVDIMREQGEQASLLMELQRIQKAASATGITSYSRQVLIKRAIQLKQQLEASYRSR